MAGPVSTAAGVLVAKYGIVTASFIGAILSLGFLKDLTRGQAATAVLTGFFFSIFLTQPVTSFLAQKLDMVADGWQKARMEQQMFDWFGEVPAFIITLAPEWRETDSLPRVCPSADCR
jgi:Na+/proline symporter